MTDLNLIDFRNKEISLPNLGRWLEVNQDVRAEGLHNETFKKYIQSLVSKQLADEITKHALLQVTDKEGDIYPLVNVSGRMFVMTPPEYYKWVMAVNDIAGTDNGTFLLPS